jgi:peroxiredoxin
VWQEKEKDGVRTMGIVRSTFVIGKQGLLAYVAYGVTPQGHAEAVLELVQGL